MGYVLIYGIRNGDPSVKELDNTSTICARHLLCGPDYAALRSASFDTDEAILAEASELATVVRIDRCGIPLKAD